MTSVGVTITGLAADDFVQSQQAVWASLPVSLSLAAGAPRLAAIDGRAADWVDTLDKTIRRGAAAVLVVHPAAGPSAPDIRAVGAAAAAAETIVAVQSTWAANPAVAPFARAVTERDLGLTLVDSVVQLGGSDRRRWTDVLLDHLSLVRAAVGPLERARFAVRHEHGYTFNSVLGNSTVAMSAVRSATPLPAVQFTAYGTAAEAHLTVPTSDNATPATAWFVDPRGAVIQPTWYETASRASWRRLHDAVAGSPGETLPDLGQLAADIALLATVTSGGQKW